MCGRDSDQKADLTGGGRSARMLESVLHCGERAMPGSWSWLTLNCPLDRDECRKSLFWKVKEPEKCWCFDPKQILQNYCLERVELLLCRAGQVHMSKCIAAHQFFASGNRRLYQ